MVSSTCRSVSPGSPRIVWTIKGILSVFRLVQAFSKQDRDSLCGYSGQSLRGLSVIPVRSRGICPDIHLLILRRASTSGPRQSGLVAMEMPQTLGWLRAGNDTPLPDRERCISVGVCLKIGDQVMTGHFITEFCHAFRNLFLHSLPGNVHSKVTAAAGATEDTAPKVSRVPS